MVSPAPSEPASRARRDRFVPRGLSCIDGVFPTGWEATPSLPNEVSVGEQIDGFLSATLSGQAWRFCSWAHSSRRPTVRWNTAVS
ncbi:hypothetical protein BJP46_31545 [Paenibacillus odorifer]|nr:hypothetical protein BJP46_31545 [Paenibacillus odorifer]